MRSVRLQRRKERRRATSNRTAPSTTSRLVAGTVADAIADAVASFDTSLCLVGLAGSELLAAAERSRLRCAAEGFADRSYEPDGTLTPRSQPGSVIADPDRAAQRAVRMVRDGRDRQLETARMLAVKVDTICVHGDTPDAEKVRRRAVRAAWLVNGGCYLSASV